MNKRVHERHLMVTVAEKTRENPDFATLFFNGTLDFSPGQFVMLWIPGLDEKPYTLSYHSPERFGITVEAKGVFSKRAICLEPGDRVGIRGAFGTGFDIPTAGRVAVVAGGAGMAPLASLVEQLKADIVLIHGARSKDLLLYPGRFAQERAVCTDDGSAGHHGFVTDLLEEEIRSGRRLDRVYACGPEIMMARVFAICEEHGIGCQVSLERYMRCGFGLCGACVCGDRIVCRDGPVFGSEALRTMADFNQKALLKSGKAVDLPAYFSWRSRPV